MALDRGTRGVDRAPRRRRRAQTDDTVRQLSLQEARAHAEALRQQRAVAPPPPAPVPVRGENAADKARAPRSARARFEQRRNEEIARQYGVGGPKPGVSYQGDATNLVRGLTGIDPDFVLWSVTHPIDRIQGNLPEQYVQRDASGLPINAGTVTGPGGFIARRAAKNVAAREAEQVERVAEDITSTVQSVQRKRDVQPYVSTRWEGVGDPVDSAYEQGYLYHRTTPQAFRTIRKRGLVPVKPKGNPAGVYFGNHPLQARGLAWKSQAESVYVRVRRDKVGALEERSFGESLTPNTVSPRDLEYLGADGVWHPLQTPAEQVVGALGEAKKLRLQQEKLYREERSKRAKLVEEALADPNLTEEEAHRAALRALKGELPKIRFGGLEGQMDQQTVGGLFKHIRDHEELRPYEKLNARRALENSLEGRVPTRGEIKLLTKVFGPDTAAQIQESVGFWEKAKTAGLNVINVPRALKASFDISAPFRQGLALGARHPRMFAKEFGPMLKSFRSEGAYQDVMDDIVSRPTFGQMQKAKLALTDLEGLSLREEQFMSNLAERIPIAGRGVRGSGRAYTAFLNKFRADAFDHYLQAAESQGLDITDEALLKSIASWVNHATGRGSIKKLESAMVPLNALLFSPRLLASRLQLLNPVYYAKLDPFARKQALRGMAQLGGALSLTLWMAKMAGAQVGLDPRSTDFGKVKLGDTRIDVAGGFQQYLVLGSRLATQQSVSTTTGATTDLAGGFAQQSPETVLRRFGRQKLAPVPAYLYDLASHETFTGDPFNPALEAGKLVVPLGWEQTYETARDYGIGAAAASYGLGSVGFGVQTYKAKPPRGATKDYKEQLAEIKAAVKRGEIDDETAQQLRDSARTDFETAIRERDLSGKSEEERDRQLMIDDAVRTGMPLDELNGILTQTGYPAATPDDLTDTELALLELRATN